MGKSFSLFLYLLLDYSIGLYCCIWCNKPYWLVLLSAVEVPTAVLGAEFDQISPPALLKQFEEVLAAKSEVDGYVKIFPKVSHGWTVRYNAEDKSAAKFAEEAHQNMLEWFAKYVK
ncbi:hypothetical protein WN944_025643 [Citrus x changshan-huyou]|uniref:Dienelactone hydrolase domain-containing protein n=1 Tax=Citrus x changshan-huyou TaxID=2935761 RepID=A0AAP0LQ85_9ROSI